VARGWESKSVEEQQSAFRREADPGKVRPTAEQTEQHRRREGLQLSRTRILAQIGAAKHENHRKMLEQTLAELDAQLSQLPNL
jgi:hypothetical protein